jgi:hypothetical protein
MNKLGISMVADAITTTTSNMDIAEIIEQIRTGKWRVPIEKIRMEYSRVLQLTGDMKAAKLAVAPLKKKLPGFTPSGQFINRNKPVAEKLLAHSGLYCADLDHLGERLAEVRTKLKTSPYLRYLFMSPSGDGLKAPFRVPADAAKHNASFRAIRQHIRELVGEEIDLSCSDVGRLCFVSYDPDVFSNDNAVEITPLAEKPKPAPVAAVVSSAPEIEIRRRITTEMLGAIDWQSETRGFCICPGRHLHTTGNNERDCEIHLDGAPTIHCFHNSCSAIRAGVNHELRSRVGNNEHISRARTSSVRSEYLGAGLQQSEWREPKSLPADLPAVPPFDFACLPDTLRVWIEDIADRMQCPPDFPAVGAMIALGSLVGRKIGIRPKRHDDWLVIPNLWGCIVGRPGLMKTPALEQPLLPMRRLVNEALDSYTSKMQEHEVNSILKSQGAKLAEKKIAGHMKKGDDKAARAEAEAIVKKENDEPVCRRYETNDPTIEKLGVLLAENPTGLLLFRDELIGFFRGLDKEGHESDRATYLEMWNGTGSFTSDRIQRGMVRAPAILSILGGIQPDLLTAYVREAVRGGQGADGLLQRIQLFVWPDISKEWHHVDRWPNTEAKDRAFEVFKYLDSLTAASVSADSSSGIPFLRFTDDAQGRFDLWRAKLEKTLRSDIEHPAFEAHLSKYRKLVPALALLIHLANRDTGAVSLAALDKAFLWATYLEAHARRIYSAVLRPDTAAARELAKHLKRGELPERFTLRETYRKGWAGLSSKEDAEAATEILCDLGWIRAVANADRSIGRPASPNFETNPKIATPPRRELTELTKPTSGSFGNEVHPLVDKFTVQTEGASEPEKVAEVVLEI